MRGSWDAGLWAPGDPHFSSFPTFANTLIQHLHNPQDDHLPKSNLQTTTTTRLQLRAIAPSLQKTNGTFNSGPQSEKPVLSTHSTILMFYQSYALLLRPNPLFCLKMFSEIITRLRGRGGHSVGHLISVLQTQQRGLKTERHHPRHPKAMT